MYLSFVFTNSHEIFRRGAVAQWLRCLLLIPGIVSSRFTMGHNHDSSYNTSIGWFQEAGCHKGTLVVT